MREIKPLTTLRAIAALLVFLYHYAVLHAPEGGAHVPLRTVWAHGYLGVPMFFVLSGFLLTRLYFDPLRDGGVGLGTFLLRRVARIWPLFLVLALVQHLGAWALGRLEPGPRWLVTLTMNQGWFAGALYDGLPQAWSLTIEETFYLLLPLFCLALDRAVFPDGRVTVLRTGHWLRLGAALLGLVLGAALLGDLAWRLADQLGWHWYGFLNGRDHVLRMTLAGRLPEFAVGMGAAFVHRDGRLLASGLRRVLGPLTLLLLLAIGGMMALKDTAPPGGQYALHLGVAVATGALILALCGDHAPARVLSWRPLVFLGRVSYAFYLVQLTIVAEACEQAAALAGPWRTLALFLLLIAVSSACYEWLERPARRVIVARWAPRDGAARG